MNPVKSFEQALLANRVAERYAAAKGPRFDEREGEKALQDTARKLGSSWVVKFAEWDTLIEGWWSKIYDKDTSSHIEVRVRERGLEVKGSYNGPGSHRAGDRAFDQALSRANSKGDYASSQRALNRLPSVAVAAWDAALKAGDDEDSQFKSLKSAVDAGVAAARSDLAKINGVVPFTSLSQSHRGDDVIGYGDIHVDGGFKDQDPPPSKEQLRDFAASAGKILRKHLLRDRSIDIKFAGRSYYSAWVLSVPIEVQGKGQVRLASMSESEFWKLTEPYGWGTKTKDDNAIKKNLMGTIAPKEAEALRATFSKLSDALYKAITDYERDNEVSAHLGDDSFGDMIAHVIGLGRNEYAACLKNPLRAIERGQKGKFSESFAYALPSESDYESLNVGKYVARAKEVVGVYESLSKASEDDIPWLPKIKADLQVILTAMRDFIRTEDFHELLAQDDEVRKSVKDVSAVLKRLNPGQSEDGSVGAAIYEGQNEWFVWNILSDLKNYLT